MFGLPFVDAWFRSLQTTLYEDMIDRLNYYVTGLLLLFCTLLLGAKQYVGSPIQCWFPANFPGGWEEWGENYCFIQNTYFVAPGADIPGNRAERKSAEIGYYQWVPIMLAAQGLMFYLPHFFWKLGHGLSGMNLAQIMEIGMKANVADSAERKKHVRILVDHLLVVVKIRHGVSKIHSLSNISITLLYLVTKFFFVMNVILQFLLMNRFLGCGAEDRWWGLELLSDVLNSRNWTISGRFPRVTLCDVPMRNVGQQFQLQTVQCVLMINMLNEKIYLFLWFWMFLVAIVTIPNFLYWLGISIFSWARIGFLAKYIRVLVSRTSATDSNTNAVEMAKRLSPDGILCLRFIGAHLGDLVVVDIGK